MSADVVIKAGWPRLLTFDPDAAGRKVTLPDARDLQHVGGPHFWLENIDTVNSIEVEDAAGGTVVAALGPEETAIIGLIDNTTLAGTWQAIVRSFV